MSFFTDLYQNTLAENQRNILFWEDYLQNLKALDFSTFADKLRVPVMVPIGSRILFRGELKHTNEITVALGADYFVKCSAKQAEVLRQYRIKDAELKLDGFRTEREYIENKVSFANDNIFKNQGQEIVELHTEDEDRAWREKHKENVKLWKQKKSIFSEPQELTDEELWNRLDELELQEDLENELIRKDDVYKKDIKESFIIKEEHLFEKKTNNQKENIVEPNNEIVESTKISHITETVPIAAANITLKEVRDKQIELEEKLLELRNQDREDIIETENVTSEEELEEEDTENKAKANVKRRVSFADEDDSETLELTFHHSDVESSNEPYDPRKGVTKPSDIYVAFENSFNETKSILKKTKYESINKTIKVDNKYSDSVILEAEEEGIDVVNRTIVVKDVEEKRDCENSSESAEKRPVSLFKQRRQQHKKYQ